MTHRLRNGFRIAATLVGLLASVAGCSKKDNPAGPGNGGNGLELDSGLLSQHQTYSHTFTTAGTYPYYCTRHAITMKDTIIVQAGGAMSRGVDISGNAYSPARSIVGPGGTVTWTNHDLAQHSVTSESP